MSTASRGRALEHKARHELEAAGWLVIRSAGSKGAADLIGGKCDPFGNRTRLVIQAKATPGPLSPYERSELITYGFILDASAIHYLRSGRGTYEWRRLTGTGPSDYEPWSPS